MAEVATRRSMVHSSNAHQLVGSGGNGGSSEATVSVKRKSPSELRENVTTDGLKDPFVRQPWISSLKDSYISTTSNKETRITKTCNTKRKCSYGSFRSVAELALVGEKSSSLSIDMDKAFKGLAARVPLGVSAPVESLEGDTNPIKFCSELHVPGLNIPLDFTLKTSMRVTSSSSVSWFHRLMSCGTLSGVEQFNSQAVQSVAQKLTCFPEHYDSPSAKTLYSWVHPQCSLPTSVITALTSSMKQDGQMEFLSKRQMAWETAFRSLYVMLRKNICNIFYVCSGQFVAMFTSGSGSMENRGVCNAYLSQSTTTLRSLLKEQDICFTMPLRHSKVDQDNQDIAEDRFELSEIERYLVGVCKRTNSVSDVDNSPESLLAFRGNNNVHGLYDFLLNYRFLLTSLTGSDVPLLYSPVPFENAALSAPEVKCKVRRSDSLLVSQETCLTSDPKEGSDSTSCYSIEIKDTYLPPWTIKSVLDALAANGSDFEASFVTEPVSAGLNIVLDTFCQKFDDKARAYENFPEKHSSFGITNTVITPRLSHAYVKCLKYSEGSFTASLSPV